MLVASLMPDLLIRIYTNTPELVSGSRPVFYIVIAALLPLALAVNWFSGVSGTANTKAALSIEVVSIVLYLIYVYYITFVVQASLTFIWTSELVYSILLGFFSYFYIRSGKWQKMKV
jgi:Na+-driven multidrug efflux pump